VHVTKVVDLVARIPKHFSLHFSDFSTILYGIYKFADFETKRKKNKRNFAQRSLQRFGGLPSGPWPETEQRRRRPAIFRRVRPPAARATWGKGKREARGTL
jgi:hypothetical protein